MPMIRLCAAYPPADITIVHIDDLLRFDLPTLLAGRHEL